METPKLEEYYLICHSILIRKSKKPQKKADLSDTGIVNDQLMSLADN